jgi:hypothetical protein
MRRLVLLTVLSFGLALPALGSGGTGDDATLSVRNGYGSVKLNLTGSVVGRIAHGKISVTDPFLDDGQGVVFWNCDTKTRELSTTVCTGDNLRFRAIGGKYRLSVRGWGIYLSVVGRGTATLDGSGEDPSVARDGVYSLNDQAYRSLPNEPKQIELVAPGTGAR